MIHLITVVGKSAGSLRMKPQHISNFKSLMRTVTSGRVLIISTIFRSDLFYSSEKPEYDSILKMWALYTNTTVASLESKDFITATGVENSLFNYFQSINKLANNWYNYWLYKKAFQSTFINDQQNPVARTVVECDQHLIRHPGIKRTPLTSLSETINPGLTEDTFTLAMHIINNESHSN